MNHMPRMASRAAPGPGTQGTLGGPAQPSPGSSRPGKRTMTMGDEVYLWILIAAELAVIAAFRNAFSRHHGG